MKKVFGPILSIALGGLMYAFLGMSYWTMTVEGYGMKETERVNAYDMLKDLGDSGKGVGLFKFATICIMILAALLIIFGILYLLKNIKVIKGKFSLRPVAIITFAVFAFVLLLQLIALFIMSADASREELGIKISAYPSFGMWISFCLSVVAVSATAILGAKKKID